MPGRRRPQSGDAAQHRVRDHPRDGSAPHHVGEPGLRRPGVHFVFDRQGSSRPPHARRSGQLGRDRGRRRDRARNDSRHVGGGRRYVRRRQRDLLRPRSEGGDRRAARQLRSARMTARQQWSVVGAIVAAMAIGLLVASHYMKDELFPVTIGSTAPDFRAKVLGENRYKSLADYKGQVVLLNVWATWCPPCQAEMPSLQRLYQAYGGKGLKLVAVSIDDYVTEDSIRAFAKNFGITFEILHDSTHAIERIYQTTGYPESFVIGPEGTIRKKWIGPDDWSSQGNRALVAQLLGLQPPRAAGDTAMGRELAIPSHAP